MLELSDQDIKTESFKVLLKFKEICDKNNFKYCLMYGTLIGAVRHNGYIPWDDDIDVMMPRPDYEKFICYCVEHKEELKPFELFHYSTSKKYVYPIARLSNSNFIADYNESKEYGLGCFIDIYPFDGVNYEDKKHIRKVKRLIKIVGGNSNKKTIFCKNPFKTLLRIIRVCFFAFINGQKTIEKLDRLSQKYSYESSDYVECVCWEAKYKFDKELFDKTVLHKFENEFFNIPIGYHEILSLYYGDYMKFPPESDRYGHHFYRIFKK